MKAILRPHQSDAIALLRQSLARGFRRPVVQAPTGFGKTIIAAAIVEMARAKDKRVVFCAPAISLIDQTVQSFYEQGIEDIGVIQADHPMTDPSKPVQVASVQTLERRIKPSADLVIVDECHRMFKSMSEWMATAPMPFVGLSATPWARGMGEIYDDLIIASTTQKLITDGFLSPFKVFAPEHPDLSGVKIVRGDYHEGQLAKAMNTPTLVADLVSTWARLGESRATLAFCVDRAHAQSVQADFLACGVTCEYIDAFTSQSERAAIKRRFEAGQTKVVSSVGCLTTGIDWDVRCIVMARPTKSEMLFVQMIGRGLRTASGKKDVIILDHADNHARLGFVTDIRHAKLDDNSPKEQKRDARERDKALPKECNSCTFLMPASVRKCPQCGVERRRPSDVETIDGSLAEMGRASKRGKAAARIEDKQAWYAGLLWICREKNYSAGWAANKYREKFDVWPRGLSDEPAQPSPEIRSWVKSRQIAWARSKRNGAGNGAAA